MEEKNRLFFKYFFLPRRDFKWENVLMPWKYYCPNQKNKNERIKKHLKVLKKYKLEHLSCDLIVSFIRVKHEI